MGIVLFCFLLINLQSFKFVLTQGCKSDAHLVIIVDSTQHATAQDFGVQKSFINVLLFELDDKTKVKLTTLVYSNDSTCKRIADDPQKSFRLLDDRDEIRSRLDTLKYDSGGGSYDLNCVKTLAAETFHKNDNSIVLILATNTSVANELDRVDKVSNKSALVCFVSTKANGPYRIIQMTDVQNSAVEVSKLICRNKVSSKAIEISQQTSSQLLHVASLLPTAAIVKPFPSSVAYYSYRSENDSTSNIPIKRKTSVVSMEATISSVKPIVIQSSPAFGQETSHANVFKPTTSLKLVINSVDISQINIFPILLKQSTSSQLLDNPLSTSKISISATQLKSPAISQSLENPLKTSSQIKLPTSVKVLPASLMKMSVSVSSNNLPTNNETQPVLLTNFNISPSAALLNNSSPEQTHSTLIHKTQFATVSSYPSRKLELLNISDSDKIEATKIAFSKNLYVNVSNNIIVFSSARLLTPNVSLLVNPPTTSTVQSVSSLTSRVLPSFVSKNLGPLLTVKHGVNATATSKQTMLKTISPSPSGVATTVIQVNTSQGVLHPIGDSMVISLPDSSMVTTLSMLQSQVNKTQGVLHPIGDSMISSLPDSSLVTSLPISLTVRTSIVDSIFVHMSAIKSPLLSSVSHSLDIKLLNQTVIASPLVSMASSSVMLIKLYSSISISNLSMVQSSSRVKIDVQKSLSMAPINSSLQKSPSISSTSVSVAGNKTDIPSQLSPWLPSGRTTIAVSSESVSPSSSSLFKDIATSTLPGGVSAAEATSHATMSHSPSYSTILSTRVAKEATSVFATSVLATSVLTTSVLTTSVLATSVLTTSILTMEDSSSATTVLSVQSSFMTPSPSLKVLASTSSIVPPIVNLTKDLENFMNQELTNSTFNDTFWIQDFFDKSSGLLDKLQTDNTTEVMNSSVLLVDYIEDIFINVARLTSKSLSKPRRFDSKSFIVEVEPINTKSFNGYNYTSAEKNNAIAEKEEGIFIPQDFFQTNQVVNEEAVIVAMEYKPLPIMQHARKAGFKVADKVYVINIDPPLQTPFERPFKYVMDMKTEPKFDVQCVYWNKRAWDTEGCETLTEKNSSLVVCQCNHMTPFSVLMQVNEYEIPAEHRFALSMISYIGCGMSIAACLVLILSFMMCGKLVKNSRNMIHINLAIAISLSNALFIVADSVYKYQYVCLGVSIAMLYTFLSSFFWMLVEGLHVYLMVVKVFRSSGKMKVYMLIGWFLPAVIVTLAAVKYHEHFIRPNFCWISTDHFLIWIFVGPALFVLTVNTIILIMTLSASHKMCLNEMEFNRLRKVARLTLLLMPVFGLSWVFGVLAVNKQFLIFQYIFTGLNAFQGVFLFLCYCLMNGEVRREFERVRKKSGYTSSKANVFADSAFSTYIHYSNSRPPRGGRSSTLSAEDVPSTVMLTRYDPAAIPEDEEDDYPESVSNTLTKRHKKNYSIELVRLPNKALSDEDEPMQEASDVTGLLTVDDKRSDIYRSSTFSDRSSRHDRSSSIDDLLKNEAHMYKTFQNQSDGTFVQAYQV